MKNKFILLFCFLLFPLMCFSDTASSIQDDLKSFATSWNNGNIKEVMQHYKKSDSSTLIWSQITTGYNNISHYLQKTYSSKNDMGTLTTSDVKIKTLSANYALVTGHWQIKTSDDKEIGGPFSMIYENTKNGWKIILDHGTSL